jgi:peptidoglycan/xylan/chitin deacetylase (PgdA/CDA1 family)
VGQPVNFVVERGGLASLATAVLAIWQIATHTEPARAGDGQLPQCWSQSALGFHQGDQRIRKHVAAARVAPPQGQLAPLKRVGEITPGAIRRVELPPGSKKLVALTFDLCEQRDEISGYQGDIVDFLRAQNVQATFFAGGKWLLTHAERGQQLMSDPLFEVGNHSWEHRNLRVVSEPDLAQEIGAPQLAYRKLRAELALKHCERPGVTGLAEERAPEAIALFRFPYGACDPASLRAVAARGLTPIQWDVSAGDPWIGTTPSSMVQSVVAHTRPGSILIFHANGRGLHTSEALPQIVAQLRQRGFEFVTVSRLLRAGKPLIESRCYDARPGDTDRYDAIGRRLEAGYASRAGRSSKGAGAEDFGQSGWMAWPEPN